jgi:exonuclease III
MRIVTWNMGFWSHRSSHDQAWHWLLETLQADITLCQECVPPDWIGKEWTIFWKKAPPPHSKQPWGTALVTRLPASSTRLPELDMWFSNLPDRSPGENEISWIHSTDGWLASAEIEIPNVGLTLVISIHNPSYPIERERLAGIDISAIKLKKNKNLWLLDVLFYFLRDRLGKGLLLGGDFNYSRLLDDAYGESGNHEFFDRIRDEGFLSLHRMFHEEDEQTFFRKRTLGHQLDYLYADSPVAKFVVSCDVVPYTEVNEFSDHTPLVADFGSDA